MQFCPKCENMMIIKKGKVKTMKCSSCGYSRPFDSNTDKHEYTMKNKIERSSKDLTMVVGHTASRVVTEEDREANEWMFNNDEPFGD